MVYTVLQVCTGQLHMIMTNADKPQPSTSLSNSHCVSSTPSLEFLHLAGRGQWQDCQEMYTVRDHPPCLDSIFEGSFSQSNRQLCIWNPTKWKSSANMPPTSCVAPSHSLFLLQCFLPSAVDIMTPCGLFRGANERVCSHFVKCLVNADIILCCIGNASSGAYHPQLESFLRISPSCKNQPEVVVDDFVNVWLIN